jgi:hypothetical protein
MQGIDDPEMPGHFRPGRRCTAGDPFASTENLRRLAALMHWAGYEGLAGVA